MFTFARHTLHVMNVILLNAEWHCGVYTNSRMVHDSVRARQTTALSGPIYTYPHLLLEGIIS